MGKILGLEHRVWSKKHLFKTNRARIESVQDCVKEG